MVDPVNSMSTEDLIPSPWNTNVLPDDLFAKLVESVRRYGLIGPLVVRSLPKGVKQIIGGEHRWKAAKELGMAEVPIWDLGEMSDGNAKTLSIVLNRLHGDDDPEKLRETLRELVTFEPLPELLKVLPWSKAEFEELAALPQVNWSELDEPHRSKDGQRWVERIYRMPLDAAKTLDTALARAKKIAREEGIDPRLDDVGALEMVATDYLAN